MNKISFILFFIFLLQNFISAQNNWGEEEIYYAPKFIIQPPMEIEAIHFQNYSISAQNSQTLNHSSGTKIIVPANAFVNANGKIVTGKVDIKFREFNNPLDIYFSGIPMTVERAGKKEFFQSAGMVELRASQNGQEVFPNPNVEMIAIELTSDQLDDDFQMYNLDEASGEWIENGKDEVLWNSKDVLPKQSTQNDVSIQQSEALRIPIQPIIPQSSPAYFYIDIIKYDKEKKWRRSKKRKKKLTFEIVCNKDSYGIKKSIDSLKIVKPFPELKAVKNIEWIYDGKNKKEVVNFLKKVKTTNYYYRNRDSSKTAYQLKDIIITPNIENDNYYIEFICHGIKKTIEAYPDFSTNSESVDQKRNITFYKKYKNKYQRRCKEWKNLEKIYKIKMTEYEAKLPAYEKELAAFQKVYKDINILKILSPQQRKNGVTRRRMEAYTFGILNIDKLMPKLNERLLVEFKHPDETPIKYSKLVVFDQTNNAMLSFYPGEKIRFDEKAKNSLLVVIGNDLGAVINVNDFKAAVGKNKKNKITFTIAPVEKENFNKKILSDALANN